MSRVAVIGAGAWGTSLAKIACENGHLVMLWGRDAALIGEFAKTGENKRYLPGIPMPSALEATDSLETAISGADVLVVAVPSKGFREVLRRIKVFHGPVVSVTKGIEFDTGLTMSGLLEQELEQSTPVVLSGPTIARELALGMPAATVVASRDASAAVAVQEVFHRPMFRVYTSEDVLGVELGGALKNVIAIAAGIVDGLGFGDNSKAALMTRGIAEIRRLGVAAGAKSETFSGLSGLGDLTVTCFSPLSRNRTFGERLGKGGNLTEILESQPSVVEGVPTARSADQLARRLEVDAPIVREVYLTLHEKKPVKAALQSLLERDTKDED